jgi:hypothetical protein
MAATKSKKTKQQQALTRLVTKLSALRVTLRGEERILLDQMVTNATFEVAGHSLAIAKDKAADANVTTRAAKRAAGRHEQGVAIAADAGSFIKSQSRKEAAEVIGHAASLTKANPKSNPAAATAADMSVFTAASMMRVELKDKEYKVDMT